jgi:uncharacterized iron-regulated membrane protein
MAISKPRFASLNPRAIAFHAHRWMGLAIGILLCIAGITGSILVFWTEIDRAIIAIQFGQIRPMETKVATDVIIATVKAAYAPKGMTLIESGSPDAANQPYVVALGDAAKHYWQVFVNPYTGQIMGDRQWETSWVGWIYALHDKLLAGEAGTLILGIVAFLSCILSLTGLVLWPGWRKLITGFKIKWKAHPKRVSFDVHKVVGIITAIFLTMIGFTGFAWNIPQANVEGAIYAATFTAKPADPVSKPIPGQNPLPLAELLQRADAALPNSKMTYLVFPETPDGTLQVGRKQPQEAGHGNTLIALDQYTGNVVQIKDGLKPNRAEAILNQFGAVHFGTFWGLPSRLLYVLIGLAPSMLFITGSIMWWQRKRSPKKYS